MSIATQITRIQNLVDELRSNIQAKGVSLANDADLEDCVDAVLEISGGGGYGDDYLCFENLSSTSASNLNLVNRVWQKFDTGTLSPVTSGNTVRFEYNIQYSFDKVTWTNVLVNDISTSGTTTNLICQIPALGKVYLKSSDNRIGPSTNGYINTKCFYSGVACKVSGNIMSLMDGYDDYNEYYQFAGLFSSCAGLMYANELTLAPNKSWGCYSHMFYNCTGLRTVPALPDTTLTQGCYNAMFYGCTNANLVIPSTLLPATTLAKYCYSNMFYGCTRITSGPALPATTLANYCYQNMFYGCTALTTAPALPATTLATSCYEYMFYQCTALTTAPTLPATTLAGSCYYYMFANCSALATAPALNATSLMTGCYNRMFLNCTSLATAPALPATTLATSCYNGMFQGCTALTTAPVLPATTLASSCYTNMFYNCRNLNYIKAMFTTTPSTSYTNNWVSNVASTGTFVKNSAATWDVTGVYGVPSGWTIETAAA